MIYKKHSVPKSDLFHARRRSIAFLFYAQFLQPFLLVFLCLFLFQHVSKCRKGVMGHGVSGFIHDCIVFIGHVLGISPMLVIMTIHAEILPVAAVRRIVVVVVVLVVNGKQVEVFLSKLPAAAGTHPWMDSQGLFPVALETVFPDFTGPLGEFSEILAA